MMFCAQCCHYRRGAPADAGSWPVPPGGHGECLQARVSCDAACRGVIHADTRLRFVWDCQWCHWFVLDFHSYWYFVLHLIFVTEW